MVPPNTLFGGKQVHMRVDVQLMTRCSIHRGLHAFRGGRTLLERLNVRGSEIARLSVPRGVCDRGR